MSYYGRDRCADCYRHQREAEEAQREVSNLKREIDNMEYEHRREMDSARYRHHEAASELREEIDQLRSQLIDERSDYVETIERLRGELAALQRKTMTWSDALAKRAMSASILEKYDVTSSKVGMRRAIEEQALVRLVQQSIAELDINQNHERAEALARIAVSVEQSHPDHPLVQALRDDAASAWEELPWQDYWKRYFPMTAAEESQAEDAW